MNKLKKIILNLIYNSIRISKKKNSVRFLGIISFLESIILPIPPDIFLIPAVLGNKKKWLYLSIYCTIFSILGGLLGYIIGYFLWDLVGNDIINFYKAQNKIEELDKSKVILEKELNDLIDEKVQIDSIVKRTRSGGGEIVNLLKSVLFKVFMIYLEIRI